MNEPINRLDFVDVAKLAQKDGRNDCQRMWYPWVASWAQGCSLLDVGSGVARPQDMIPMGVKAVTTQEPQPWCGADILCDVSEIMFLKWDVVSSMDVLEHVVDYGKFAYHLARLANKRVVITTPGRQVTKNQHLYHYHEFLCNEVVQLFEATGMSLEAVCLYEGQKRWDLLGYDARNKCAEEPVVHPMGFVFTK